MNSNQLQWEVWEQIEDQVSGQVWDQVLDQVSGQVSGGPYMKNYTNS